MRLRVAVDATLIRRGGIGRYIRELTMRWLADDGVAAVAMLGDPESIEPFLDEADARGIGRSVAWRGGPYSPERHVRWPVEVRRAVRDVDVVFFPHYDAPYLFCPRPCVVTVHDLTHFRVPEGFPAWKRWGGRRLLDRAIQNASAVITVSEHTRADLTEGRPGLADRIEVIPNGVSDVFRNASGNGASAHNGSGNGAPPYLLTVGEARPHKNLELAVELLARLRESRPELRLLLAGEDGSRSGALLGRARTLGVSERVVPLGSLVDEELREAYSHAALVLVPSLYEGFGLPALEAMACGTPVLASSASSLPEVVGDVCPLLDPDDPEAWEREAERVLGNEQHRHRLARAGVERARRFDWNETAERTLDVLRRVSGAPRGTNGWSGPARAGGPERRRPKHGERNGS